MQKKNNIIDVWIFTTFVFIIPVAVGWLGKKTTIIPLSTISIFVGLTGFFFWTFINKKPVLEIYSRGYPYRKLKFWGAISAIIFFEYILVWGLHTKQIQLADQHLYSITVVLIGAIAFYFSFVRMKVSLRYLFLGIFIPLLASGAAVGLSKYFGFVLFSVPKENLTKIVSLNTIYWILFSILYQLICEEPAFRGFLMQRLISNGKTTAVLVSSLIYALWHIIVGIFEGMNISQGVVGFLEKFIVGCLLAILFLKGKNLLIAAVSHGIIEGLKLSLLASDRHPGLNQYFKITATSNELKFIILWFGCLFIGLIAVLIIPQKKPRCQTY